MVLLDQLPAPGMITGYGALGGFAKAAFSAAVTEDTLFRDVIEAGTGEACTVPAEVWVVVCGRAGTRAPLRSRPNTTPLDTCVTVARLISPNVTVNRAPCCVLLLSLADRKSTRLN